MLHFLARLLADLGPPCREAGDQLVRFAFSPLGGALCDLGAAVLGEWWGG